MNRLLKFVGSNLFQPIVMLCLLHSVFVGMAYLIGWPSDVKITLLWKIGVIGGLHAWSIVLGLSGLVAFVGILRSWWRVVQLAMVANFGAWMFATVSYAGVGAWLAVANYSAFHLVIALILFVRATVDLFRSRNHVLVLGTDKQPG